MKKVLVAVMLAIIVGGGLSFYFLKDLKFNGIALNEGTVSAKAFQVGVFTSYDNASNVADRNNGIVVADENVYRVYVAITSNKEVLRKLEAYYKSIGLRYYLKEISVSKTFDDNVEIYEEMILKSSVETYTTINLDVLHEYQENLF